MIFDIEDEVLIRNIQSLINTYNKDMAEKNRISAMSYDERFEEFKSHYDLITIGKSSWYEKIDCRLELRNQTVLKYFKEGEDEPCIMRGSLVSYTGQFKAKNTAPLLVFERFIRYKKITCLDLEEWRKTKDMLSDVISRISKKYGGLLSILYDSISYSYNFNQGGEVMIFGRFIKINEEQKKLIKTSLNTLNKIDKLEKLKLC